MFELFAGKPPFTGNSENELLNKHLRTPAPSVETYNKNLTYECVQLVKLMLAKKPTDRPDSMDDVLAYLRAIASIAPCRRRERSRRLGIGSRRSEFGGRKLDQVPTHR